MELAMSAIKNKSGNKKIIKNTEGGKFDGYDPDNRPRKEVPFKTKIALKKKPQPKSSKGFYVFALAFVGILFFLLFSESSQNVGKGKAHSGKSFTGFSNTLPKR
jgi:hypothetical protein